jgi:hypothetical protein
MTAPAPERSNRRTWIEDTPRRIAADHSNNETAYPSSSRIGAALHYEINYLIEVHHMCITAPEHEQTTTRGAKAGPHSCFAKMPTSIASVPSPLNDLRVKL